MNCIYCNKEMKLYGKIYCCYNNGFIHKNINVLVHSYQASIHNNTLSFSYYIANNQINISFSNSYSLDINNIYKEYFYISDLSLLKDIKTVKDLNNFINKITVFQ